MERLQLLTEAISSGQDIYDYIIIGAGISGLQAAEIITSKPNAKLLILEAQGYLGGRIGSISIGGLDNAKKTEWVQKNIDKINAAIVEKGATWVEERHLVVRELCKQFGITLREQHSEGTSTFLAKDRPYTQIELMNHPEYAPTIKLIIELIDSISEQYNEVVYSDLNLPSHEAKQMLKKYDRMTLEQFLIDRIPERQQIVRDIFDGFFEHTECLRCSENSMHEVLTKNARSNDLGILKEFLGDFGHE
jgi:tRNA U34 5-carboxymethylaminomethyl modifying enzyme MnmG/GidA